MSAATRIRRSRIAAGSNASARCRQSLLLQQCEVQQGLVAARAAHGRTWFQRYTDCWSFRHSEQAAAKLIIELHAGYARGLAKGHAGNGARNRGRDAAGRAATATDHGSIMAVVIAAA